MNNYLQSKNPEKCCGCRACEQICPKKAISMTENAEGFLYPQLDPQKCIACNLCSVVCPVENRPKGNPPIEAYAFQHADDCILQKSSSGGAFRLLADDILRQGGCVVGCVWGDGNRPVLRIAEQEQQLYPMQGSKYLFSDTNDVYSEVKRRLDGGQTVLFTGAPCQCAGLVTFLRRPYENLYTADFLCHGMPSQQIFDCYIDALERKAGAKIYDLSFRDKSKRGWGMTFSYKFRKRDKEKKRYVVGWTDPYLYGFIQGYFNRYSCYSCPFRGEMRFTDITFCDYWGVEKQHPEIPVVGGVSGVVFNSFSAVQWRKELGNKGSWHPTTVEKIAEGNYSLLYNFVDSFPALRGVVYNFIHTEGWKLFYRKFLKTRHYRIKKIWYGIPITVTKWIKKMLRR